MEVYLGRADLHIMRYVLFCFLCYSFLIVIRDSGPLRREPLVECNFSKLTQ
jgi:hypothetical protein